MSEHEDELGEDIRQRTQDMIEAHFNTSHTPWTTSRCYDSDGEKCQHDLVRGVSAEELMGPDDGPHGQTRVFGPPQGPPPDSEIGRALAELRRRHRRQ